MKNFLERQVELRQQAWHQAKAIIDGAEAEKRDLSGEEQASYDKINVELNERAEVITKMREDESRELRFDAATREIADQVRPLNGAQNTVSNDAAIIRELANGERRSYEFEKRDILTSATGAPIPTNFYDKVIMKARLVAPMLDPQNATILNTSGGANLQIPSLSAYSTAVLAGQGTGISESDPEFNSFITLGAYKYAFVVQVTSELLSDSGVDFLSFLADQTGNALGFDVGRALTVGTGSSQPKGIVPCSSAGGTGATAVSGAFTADNLIDLLYTLDGAARVMPGCAFMMNGTSIGAVRKLKDTAGYYIFQPALALGSPDTLLGKRLVENPSIVSPATSAKSVIVGDLASFYVRTVGGITLARSDDFAFNADLVTFRATMRVDSNCPQASHIKHFVGGAS